MMRITTDNGNVVCEADLDGRIAVYLDNDAIIELAKGPIERRNRFLAVMTTSGTLMLSLANAFELGGPQGASATAVEQLLDGIGPQWVLLELNPWTVVKRELAGLSSRAPLALETLTAYFQDRAFELSPGGTKVLDLSSDTFFKISPIARWERERRAKTAGPGHAERVDDALRQRIEALRLAFDADTNSLDQELAPLAFAADRPALFALTHLLRLLTREAKSHHLKRNDGIDLSHAAIGSAYANLMTVDKHWKRRLESLPTPNGLAEVFYRAELDRFVERLELLAQQLQRTALKGNVIRGGN